MTQPFDAQIEETASSPWAQFQGQIVDGQFLLRDHLGGSDHSAVFLTDGNLAEPRKAAVKLILETPEKAELQLSRWELAAHLSHPHLIRLFQTGRCLLGTTKLLYAVMEYADEDLSQIVPRRSLASEEAREMLRPALDALAYIHSKGFVHGHIKPANIMACGDQVKLSIDALCETDEHISGLSVYDPPESTASTASDLWSLGVTLVEVLTQHLPARRGGQNTDPFVPRTIAAPFLEIARGCLRSNPKQRWKIEQIAACLRPEAARNSPKSPAQHERAVPQGEVAKRSYTVPTVGVLLLLAAMVAGPSLFKRRPDSPRPLPEKTEKHRPETTPTQKAYPAIQQPSAVEQVEKNDRKRTAAESGVRTPSGQSPSEERAPLPSDNAPQSGVLHEVFPTVPEKARDTIQGTIRVAVKVVVDASGTVKEATLDSSGPSKYFSNLALQAAQQWKFDAPGSSSGDSANEWILRFEFSNAGTKVIPTRTAQQ